MCWGILWRVVFGFFYMYVCFVLLESDFYIVNEKYFLFYREDDKLLEWVDWKILVREFF